MFLIIFFLFLFLGPAIYAVIIVAIYYLLSMIPFLRPYKLTRVVFSPLLALVVHYMIGVGMNIWITDGGWLNFFNGSTADDPMGRFLRDGFLWPMYLFGRGMD